MKFKAIITILFILCCLFATHQILANDASYTVEGKIYSSNQGKIYVYLVNETIFQKPLTGIQTIILDSHSSVNEMSATSFSFQDIKAGNYGIRCFQDVNDNGTLDRGMFGPSEPWGMSWNTKKPSVWPRYEEISFQVDADLRPIDIKLK